MLLVLTYHKNYTQYSQSRGISLTNNRIARTRIKFKVGDILEMQ
jgi:hypothetical protein